MAKVVYCSDCGAKLELHRKALPAYGRIIDLVDPHKCTEEPQELDLTPINYPTEAKEGKFVQNLNELPRRGGSIGMVGTDGIGDRRKAEHQRSTAPPGLRENLLNMANTPPEGDISDEPEE